MSEHDQRIMAMRDLAQDLRALYQQLQTALIVTTDTPKAAQAVQDFLNEWDRTAEAFAEDRADDGLMHMRQAAGFAMSVADHSHQIRVVGGR